jgi:pimeloyl-ACP methyl ester carboxylesterase
MLRDRGVEGIARDVPARLLSAAATPAARAWVRWNAARLDPAGYAQAVEMLCSDDIERYADVAAPIEVHVGSADVVTPPEACRRIAERLRAQFATIADAGHASPVEQPERIARLVTAALARCPTAEERP